MPPSNRQRVSGVETKKRRICGFSPMIFWTAFGVIVALISAGATIAGVMVEHAKNKSESSGSSNPESSKTSAATPSPTGTLVASSINNQTGHFSTTSYRKWNKPQPTFAQWVSFPAAFESDVGISLAFGITSINLEKRNQKLGLRMWADTAAADGFMIHLDGIDNSALNYMSFDWLAIPGDTKDDGSVRYQVGQFGTDEVRSETTSQSQTSKRILFEEEAFEAVPTVVAWVNGFSMSIQEEWHVNTYVTDVSSAGFTAHVDAESGCVLYAGNISWVAFSSAIAVSGTMFADDIRPLDEQNSSYGQLVTTEWPQDLARAEQLPSVVNGFVEIHTANTYFRAWFDEYDGPNVSATGMSAMFGGVRVQEAGMAYIAVFP